MQETIQTEPRDYAVLGLFSGLGGLDRGFRDYNDFDVVAANEVWKPAADSYRHNHPRTTLVEGDIRRQGTKEEIVSAFAGRRCHAVIGGPTCKAFSLAGRRDPNDPRASLFEEYLAMVEKLAPAVCVMENVEGLLSFRKDGEPIINTIRKGFDSLGYETAFKVLDAADYGTAQHRRRVIIVARPRGRPFVWPEPTHGPGTGVKWRTVRDAIGMLANREEMSRFAHKFTDHGDDFRAKIRRTGPGESVLPGRQSAFRRLLPHEPAWTVMSNNGGVFIHYEEDRCLTPREMACLQDIPLDWKLHGGKTDMLEQIGNAVPVRLASAIAGAVKQMLDLDFAEAGLTTSDTSSVTFAPGAAS